LPGRARLNGSLIRSGHLAGIEQLDHGLELFIKWASCLKQRQFESADRSQARQTAEFRSKLAGSAWLELA